MTETLVAIHSRSRAADFGRRGFTAEFAGLDWAGSRVQCNGFVWQRFSIDAEVLRKVTPRNEREERS